MTLPSPTAKKSCVLLFFIINYEKSTFKSSFSSTFPEAQQRMLPAPPQPFLNPRPKGRCFSEIQKTEGNDTNNHTCPVAAACGASRGASALTPAHPRWSERGVPTPAHLPPCSAPGTRHDCSVLVAPSTCSKPLVSSSFPPFM